MLQLGQVNLLLRQPASAAQCGCVVKVRLCCYLATWSRHAEPSIHSQNMGCDCRAPDEPLLTLRQTLPPKLSPSYFMQSHGCGDMQVGEICHHPSESQLLIRQLDLVAGATVVMRRAS